MLSGLVLTAVLAAQPAPAAPPGPLPPGTSAAAQPAAPSQTPLLTVPAGPPAYQPCAEPTAPQPPIFRDTHLGPPDSVWFGGDYLMYWLKPAQVPLLVASSQPGQPLVPVLGDRDYEFGPAHGGRLHAGAWLNDRHTVGLGASVFLLEQKTLAAGVNSGPDGSPRLVRPFVNALLGQSDVYTVSDPVALNRLIGGVSLSAGARLSGADLFVVRNIASCLNYSFDVLAGGKYLDLDEYLAVTQVSRPVGQTGVFFNVNPNLPLATQQQFATLTLVDRFRTRNQFWGGVLGVRGEYRFGPAFVNLTLKGGVGNNRQTVDIDGFSEVSVPREPRLPGGLLALQGANLGRRVSNRLTVLAEAGAQVGVQVSRHLRVTLGYDLLYLEDVARPGDQIDPIISPALVPTSEIFRQVGIVSPIRTRARDDWYAHGVRVGMELQY